MTTTSLDKATAERHQLDRNYRAAEHAELLALYADPAHGTHLRKLVATLNHFGPDHADRVIAYWRAETENWLGVASDDIRNAALHALAERIVRIRVKAGLVPFDDPVGDEPDDVFRVCRGIMGI